MHEGYKTMDWFNLGCEYLDCQARPRHLPELKAIRYAVLGGERHIDIYPSSPCYRMLVSFLIDGRISPGNLQFTGVKISRQQCQDGSGEFDTVDTVRLQFRSSSQYFLSVIDELIEVFEETRPSSWQGSWDYKINAIYWGDDL